MTEHIFENIPENIRQFVDPSLPRDMRMSAASGYVPLLPNEMALVLYVLTLDEDEELALKARESLDDIPSSLISSILQDTSTHSRLLDYFARHSEDDGYHLFVSLNSSADDESIAYLARTTHSQQLLEAIAQNHQRIIRSAEVVDSLSLNPATSRSTIDSVIDYISLYLGEDRNESEDESSNIQEGQVHEEMQEPSLTRESISFLDDVEIDNGLMEELEECDEEDEEVETGNVVPENLQFQISMMTTGEKLKLALMGNGETRRILVRDPNRIISKAVLSNPRLTDSEIQGISQSKVVSDEILRTISDNRRWIKMYPVKLSLVNNPKTPPQVAMNLMRQLRNFDIKSIARSKNLAGIVTTTAKRILSDRQKRA